MSYNESYERQRQEQIERMRREMDSYHQREANLARDEFKFQRKLLAQIMESILPCLVFIRTGNGIRGMGYFQHGMWLVSNAHILSCKEILDRTMFFNFKNKPLNLTVIKSYHRPISKDTAPDLVVINADRHFQEIECFSKGFYGFPTKFNSDTDAGHSETIYFYINTQSTSVEIKFIQKLSLNDTYPIIFACNDGTSPQPGDSGSPVFEARVLIDREPRWQFRVVGALYARCSPAWYNSKKDIKAVPALQTQKLVCAIPADSDFQKILSILHHESHSQRTMQMGMACQAIGDSIAKRDEPRYLAMSKDAARSAQREFQEFHDGMTPLNIELPDGLEKLWYQGIVKIQDSLLINKILKREIPRKDTERFSMIPDISLQDLQGDFQKLIDSINQEENIILQKRDNFITSPLAYFRVDVGGGSKDGWKLDIQDNTGKHHYDKKSLSSVFAIVKISKAENSILGKNLASLFSKSQDSLAPQDSALFIQTEKSAVQGGRRAVSKTIKEYAGVFTFYFEESIYEGRQQLSDGRVVNILEVEEALGDGDCGFRSILGREYLEGVFDRHSQVIEFFKSQLQNKNICLLIAKDLLAKYQEWIANIKWDNDSLKFLIPPLLLPLPIKQEFQRFRYEALCIGNNELQQRKLSERMNQYCMLPVNLMLYLKLYLGDKKNWSHLQGSLTAFAYLHKMKLHCFQVMPADQDHPKDWLYYISDIVQPIEADYYQEEVFILQNKARTHFNRLSVKFE